MQFQDRVVLVTVVSSGIGAGGPQAFARAGARVTLADINAEQGQQCLEAIKVDGGQAVFF